MWGMHVVSENMDGNEGGNSGGGVHRDGGARLRARRQSRPQAKTTQDGRQKNVFDSKFQIHRNLVFAKNKSRKPISLSVGPHSLTRKRAENMPFHLHDFSRPILQVTGFVRCRKSAFLEISDRFIENFSDLDKQFIRTGHEWKIIKEVETDEKIRRRNLFKTSDGGYCRIRTFITFWFC